jgi:hypothetical protein
MPVFRFPFDIRMLPKNGIYVIFEDGEMAHGTNRIVRVGTHTGNNQLPARLQQHFIKENKDRSIFRKNIGRALLNRDCDPFLHQWELDLTSAEARRKYISRVDLQKQKQVEQRVSAYIQTRLRFIVFEVMEKDRRLEWESRIISSVSWCDECGASQEWLGNFSPKEKIRRSGLWIVNELYKKPFSADEFTLLKNQITT